MKGVYYDKTSPRRRIFENTKVSDVKMRFFKLNPKFFMGLQWGDAVLIKTIKVNQIEVVDKQIKQIKRPQKRVLAYFLY